MTLSESGGGSRPPMGGAAASSRSSKPGRSKLANEFSWSMSRHKLFDTCRRAYYYKYYGAWGAWEHDADDRVKLLDKLKQLKNRFTLGGEVLHSVIAYVLGGYRYGNQINLQQARNEAVERLRAAFVESRSDLAATERKAVRLFEHEYNESVPDEQWQSMRDRVTRCLDNFYTSTTFEAIRKADIERWLPIENLDSFQFQGTKIFAAIDFAMKNSKGNAVVMDWKSGRKVGIDRLQMVTYGLFAHKKWDIPPWKAIGELHYLYTGEVDVVTLEESVLEQGKSEIQNSIAAMKSLLDDPAKNTASESKFEKTTDHVVCRSCNFRKVCWPDWPSLGKP